MEMVVEEAGPLLELGVFVFLWLLFPVVLKPSEVVGR